MNTIDDWFVFFQKTRNKAAYDAMVAGLHARHYVLNRLPDAHVVRTTEKNPTEYCVGIYSVELTMNKRQLIDVNKAAAPQLVGKVVNCPGDAHSDYVFAIPAWTSAAKALKALEEAYAK